METLDKAVSLVIIGGVGYLAYDFYTNGFCGGLFSGTPICATGDILEGSINFFKGMQTTGDAGVPFELESCGTGYTDFGLTCTSCKSIGDCFSGNGCGCDTYGKLDHQICPASHPDKFGLLCYRACPQGWEHVEGMPYMCRRGGSDNNFWNAVVGDNWKAFIPFGKYL